MAEECLFCAIASGKIPSFKVYENDNFVAFLDINPANIGHIILITKKHFSSIMEVDPTIMSEMFLVARALSLPLLEEGYDGVNFLVQIGDAAGQRVPHMYLHIVPRKKGDQIPLAWNPQKATEAQLKEMRDKLASRVKMPKDEPKKVEVIEMKPKDEPKKEVYTFRPRTGGR